MDPQRDGHILGVAPGQFDATIVPEVYEFALRQNYPNPFNPTTTISYSVADRVPVAIDIFNVRGQLVRTLLRKNAGPGNHTVFWDGLNNQHGTVASGVYFYRLTAGPHTATRKMVLLR